MNKTLPKYESSQKEKGGLHYIIQESVTNTLYLSISYVLSTQNNQPVSLSSFFQSPKDFDNWANFQVFSSMATYAKNLGQTLFLSTMSFMNLYNDSGSLFTAKMAIIIVTQNS